MEDKDYWYGWIEELDDDFIYCHIRKAGELNCEFKYPLKKITEEQLPLVEKYHRIRYDMNIDDVRFAETIWI